MKNCPTGKRAYYDAYTAAMRARQRPAGLTPYKCRACGWFHLGHRSPQQDFRVRWRGYVSQMLHQFDAELKAIIEKHFGG